MKGPPLFWRLVVRLLPKRFRDRHQADMEAALAVHLEGRGRVGRALVWGRAGVDTVVTAVRMRRADRLDGRGGEGMIMDRLLQDLGFALKALRRRPGFTLVAVLTLAVGIGANTAIFSVVNGVLFRPLPYADADRIGILWHEFGDGAQNLPAVHPLDVIDYRDRSRLFETFTFATGRELILGGAEDPEVVDVGLVEAGFFEFFGANAELGRTISPEEDVPGMAPVAVLSHRLWTRRFGADPSIVGRTVPVGGGSVEVVGVLPRTFRLLLPGEAFRLRDAELWMSARLDPARMPPRNFTGYTGFGRLRPGATFAQAQDEIEVLAQRLREEHPEHAASKLVARVVPLHQDVVKGADRTLMILFGAVGLVLLIACANVANLVMVRGQTRAAEMSLRSALGAGRPGLVRLVLVESAVLSAAGVALGMALARGGLAGLRVMGPGSVPRLDAVQLDGTVLAFAAAAGAVSVILFGLIPALSASRSDPARDLQSGGRGGESRRRRRLRSALIVGEVAASLVLLVGSGLLVRTFSALTQVDPGFEVEGALTFRTSLPQAAFSGGDERDALQRQLVDELESLPTVESAAVVSQLPLTGSGPLAPYAYDEETASNWESVTADQRFVTPGFFQAMGARLLQGRTFTGQVESDRGTIVVDDRLAARAFPDRDPLGARLQIAPNDTPEAFRYATVVGVVEHIRLHDLSRPHLTQIYFPQRGGGQFSVVVRSSGDPAALAPDVRAVMARLAPGAPVEAVQSLEALASASLAPLRLALGLMTGFGLVALLLASVGVYGVLSYVVSRRTREIGVRMALGQAPTEVRRAVLMEGAGLIGLALVVGVGVAALSGKAVESLLYGVAPTDPATFAAASAVLVAVSLMACWIPARRATRIDPAVALRE